MSTQFEFRLVGADAPEGELDADHLIAIVGGLKEVATSIGRAETDAEPIGRAPKRVQRVARLMVGTAPGSTRILARRAADGAGSLDFDLAEEEAFDEGFEALVESIAADERPAWVGDSLAHAAADLAAALKKSAPEVEFKVAGTVRRTFKTDEIHRDTWRVTHAHDLETVAFVGRLYAVNLNTHRLAVQDDVGNQIALPRVSGDAAAARLLGSHVTVTGRPERDARGALTQLHEAAIAAAPDPLAGDAASGIVTLEEILASAPGVEPGGIPDLTDAEADSFFEAMGL